MIVQKATSAPRKVLERKVLERKVLEREAVAYNGRHYISCVCTTLLAVCLLLRVVTICTCTRALVRGERTKLAIVGCDAMGCDAIKTNFTTRVQAAGWVSWSIAQRRHKCAVLR